MDRFQDVSVGRFFLQLVTKNSNGGMVIVMLLIRTWDGELEYEN